eukprot:Amastigsp_a174491_449.p2 type:complete len:513 gc:universal Amastigsp_a174491_449:1590-52(-)
MGQRRVHGDTSLFPMNFWTAAAAFAAICALAQACIRQNLQPLELNGGLDVVTPYNVRFFGNPSGATKCVNSSNPAAKPLCQYNYPYQVFVEVELVNVTSPQVCTVALATDWQVAVNAYRPPEALAQSTFMRYEGSRVVKAEVVLMDIKTNRIIRRVPGITFTFSKDASEFVSSTIVAEPPFNASSLIAFTGTVQMFNTSTIIYDWQYEVPFVAFSIVAQYFPIIDSTGLPAEPKQCESFKNEQFFDCTISGVNDRKYSGNPGHNFYDFSGVIPTPIKVFAGTLAADGKSAGGISPATWYNSSLNIKTPGLCTADSQCGAFQRCSPATDPPTARYCQDCSMNTDCNPAFSQPFFPSTCITSPVNKAAWMCNYTPVRGSIMPAPAPDPSYDSATCTLATCTASQYCTDSGCVECRTTADCNLPYTVEGAYTKLCDRGSCFYSFPSPAPFKSIKTKVIIIGACVAGGVCIIGVAVGVLVWMKKRTKDIAADNVLHDALGKEKASGKAKKHDPFAD